MAVYNHYLDFMFSMYIGGVDIMTFEERCERFLEKTEEEANIFKYVCRVVFLNKKISDYEREFYAFDKEKLIMSRPKDRKSCKQIITK